MRSGRSHPRTRPGNCGCARTASRTRSQRADPREPSYPWLRMPRRTRRGRLRMSGNDDAPPAWGGAVAALCLVQFVDVLGVTVVVTALPAMLSDLGGHDGDGTLIATGYAIVLRRPADVRCPARRPTGPPPGHPRRARRLRGRLAARGGGGLPAGPDRGAVRAGRRGGARRAGGPAAAHLAVGRRDRAGPGCRRLERGGGPGPRPRASPPGGG